MNGPVGAVLLDIDDTLLDTTGAMRAAGRAGMAAVWPERDDAWHDAASARFRADPEGFFGQYTRGELAFDDMRERRLVAVAEHTGCELPARAFETYERAYRPAFDAAQRIFPDVRPFLDRCAERGIAVGALTNSSTEATTGKLAATGSADWYAVVVTRDDLGFGKPDPRVFHHACAALGVAPEQTAYLGDEVEADVIGGSRAGLRPVWVRRPPSVPGQARPHEGADPDSLPSGTLVVSDLTTLPAGLDLGTPGNGR